MEQRSHVAEMSNGDADLSNLSPGQDMVAVISRLSGKIESDREAGLALGKVFPVKAIAFLSRGMSGVGPEDPGLVRGVLHGVDHEFSSPETTMERPAPDQRR